MSTWIYTQTMIRSGPFITIGKKTISLLITFETPLLLFTAQTLIISISVTISIIQQAALFDLMKGPDSNI